MKKKIAAVLLCVSMVFSMAACGEKPAEKEGETAKKEQEKITFVLDWTPNTNHTGSVSYTHLDVYKRQAYETACAYAVSPQEEEEQCSQIDAWIKHAEEIYDSLCKRINVAQWESLLDEEICLDLETGEEIKDLSLIHILMSVNFKWRSLLC